MPPQSKESEPADLRHLAHLFRPADTLFQVSKLTLSIQQAQHPNRACSQPLGSKLTAPWEQAPEGLWAGRDFDTIL